MDPCEVVVAVDLGGTRMKCGLVAADGAVLHRETRPTPRADARDGGRAVLDALLETVIELGQKATAEGHRVRAIGVVVPGVIDAEHGTVGAENLEWVGTPVLAELTAAVGANVPIVLAHDVRAGGYAEFRQGALAGTTNSMFLPLGTGIAAAMIVDGSLVSGDGYAGELGHSKFIHGDAAELCACGQWGCLETVASAAALARRYAARTGRTVDGAREVMELLASGDPDAALVWQDALTALVDALVLYTTLVAPTRIAIGGGLIGAGETLLQPLREGVHARLTFQREPEIVAAVLGEEAGMLGAAQMAWDRAHEEETV
ncbi:glucokinase [Kribbella aluminosa]|uniref:Glucokinase n=1 Tax=Kribbella aluminosa TaxID=416017 RepID=A0ABS4UE74_9ACTN|nr:ROK family protein [Kribbella aluminosa]MBP2349952.1 glucokinase [Kribbella aluminosa]